MLLVLGTPEPVSNSTRALEPSPWASLLDLFVESFFGAISG